MARHRNDGTFESVIVRADQFRPSASDIRRAGGRIVSSAPVTDNGRAAYAVTVFWRD